MALQQTEEQFFAEFHSALEELIQALPEESTDGVQLERLLESLEDFMRQRDYAQEI